MYYLSRFVAAMLSLLSLNSCIAASTIPIASTYFERSPGVKRDTLVVFLPGRGSAASSFLEEGFVQELRRRRPDLDMIGVEAHLGYYRDLTLPLRLKEDVITPAKKLGYQHIWLVGISLGGIGAILYDTEYPGDVTGICLLAPYLGQGSMLAEITFAGGLAKWQPDAVSDGDMDRAIWTKLQSYVDPDKSAGRVFLGFGSEDRFAATNRFFGKSLPAGQVVSVPGGHDWPTWRKLWDLMLAGPALRATVPRAETKLPSARVQPREPWPDHWIFLE
jgi:pimeloyl-ACP methyl ester carboxylesterase